MSDHESSGSSSESESELPQRRRRSPSPPTQEHSKKSRHSSPPREGVNGRNVAPSLPPLSLSILGVEPLDEFIQEIADWVHGLIISRPSLDGHVEVEAKLGMLKYREGNQRLKHPVRVETILHGDDHKFESNMTAAQHKHFNNMLNKLEEASHQSGHPTSPLRHTHMKLIDTFYPGESRSDKVRVTRDEKTSEVKECMRKVRLGNLDVFSPKRSTDWRISVNLEIPASHPVGTATLTRRKDRLSYSHEEFSIDLTQVTQTVSPANSPLVMHELEVEFARPAVLMSTAMRREDPNVTPHEREAFDELIRAFVNNVRILTRNALPTP